MKPVHAAALLSLLLLAGVPMSVRAASSVQTVDISSAVSGQVQWFTIDKANSLGFLSVGVLPTNLYKVDLTNVIVQGAGAVTGYTNILGNSACNGHGNLAQGVSETLALGGNLYATYWCGSAIGVAQIRESDGTVLNAWTQTGPQDAQGLVTDGTLLYVCAQNEIYSLTTTGTFSPLHSITGDCVNEIIVGSTLWFSEGSDGIGKVNTDGTGFSEPGCGGCGSAYFLASVGSNIYFTDKTNHKLVMYDGTTFTAYGFGGSSAGPYGLVYSSSKAALYVDGYANLNIRTFYPSNSSFGATPTSTSKKPFEAKLDAGGSIWNFALGSTDLIKISSTTSLCSGEPTHATGLEVPTISLNRSADTVTPNGFVVSKSNITTISYFVSQNDAPPSAWSCAGVNKASFDAIGVSSVMASGTEIISYHVNGLPTYSTQTLSANLMPKAPTQTRGLLLCSDNTIVKTPANCSGSVIVIQTWAMQALFSTPTVGIYNIPLKAWGQNGTGPFLFNLAIWRQ